MTAAPARAGLRLGCALLMAAAIALGACGKRGSPRPPEGQESEYTFPRFYPAPLPSEKRAVARTEEEEAPAAVAPPPERERRFSPFPLDYSNPRSRTIGTISSE